VGKALSYERLTNTPLPANYATEAPLSAGAIRTGTLLVQAHGHVQVFGWAGLLELGKGAGRGATVNIPLDAFTEDGSCREQALLKRIASVPECELVVAHTPEGLLVLYTFLQAMSGISTRGRRWL
jgi:hypothetical protein